MQCPSQPDGSHERSESSSIHPECYAQLTEEIQSAQLVSTPPKDVWSSLLDKVCPMSALNVVVDLFVSASSDSNEFYVGILTCFVEYYEVNEDKEDVFSLTIVFDQLLDRFDDVPRQQADIAMLLRICRAIAVLVRNNLIYLDYLWVSSEDMYELSDSIKDTYSNLIAARIYDLQSIYAARPPHPSHSAGVVASVLSGTDVAQKTFQVELDQPCPQCVWLLVALWKEGNIDVVLHDFSECKHLILLHQPLRHLLMTYVLECLQDEYLSPHAFVRVLALAAHKLGPHLGQNFCLFLEACRRCAEQREPFASLEALRLALLPALSFYRVNEDAADAVWSCLKFVDLDRRIRLYDTWQNVLYDQVHVLRLVKIVTEHDVLALMRSLTEENVDSAGKSIALLAATNPLLVWKHVVEFTFETQSLVPVVVQIVISYSGSFAQDALAFVLLNMFKENEQPLFDICEDPDEIWFYTLSKLTARLFSRSTYLQETWLFHYLSLLGERLESRSAELWPLWTLLQNMSDVYLFDCFEDIDMKDFEALSGSKHLVRELFFPTTLQTLQKLSESTTLSERRQSDTLVAEENSYAERSYLLPTTYPSSTKHLFRALYEKDLGVQILRAISRNQWLTDTPFLSPMRLSQRPELCIDTFQLLLLNLKLGALEYPNKVDNVSWPKHWGCNSSSFPDYMDVSRLFLRSQIDSHSFTFVHDFNLIPYEYPANVDLPAFALFWALDSYDLYVPVRAYKRNRKRISALGKGKETLPQIVAERKRILDSLAASYEKHKTHVAWILMQMPSIRVFTLNPHEFLRKMVIPRAIRTLSDPLYVYYFLCCTLDDPLPIFDALFDTEMLLEQITTLSKYEICNVGLLLRHIWADLRKWSFYSSLQLADSDRSIRLKQRALCKDIWEQEIRNYCESRPVDVQGCVCSPAHYDALHSHDSAFADTHTRLRYTLFRYDAGTKIENYKQRWMDNISRALTVSRRSRGSTNAIFLKFAFGNEMSNDIYTYRGRSVAPSKTASHHDQQTQTRNGSIGDRQVCKKRDTSDDVGADDRHVNYEDVYERDTNDDVGADDRQVHYEDLYDGNTGDDMGADDRLVHYEDVYERDTSGDVRADDRLVHYEDVHERDTNDDAGADDRHVYYEEYERDTSGDAGADDKYVHYEDAYERSTSDDYGEATLVLPNRKRTSEGAISHPKRSCTTM